MAAVNRERPHLYIVPEDDADRQLANGFISYYEVNHRQVQVLNEADGWPKVIDTILNEYIPILRRYPHAHVLGLIDCDDRENRIQKKLDLFPDDFRDRIFLLGFTKDPEKFKRVVKMGKDPERFKGIIKKELERIGYTLAEECFLDALALWNHEQLQHISAEIDRAKTALRPIIFA